MKIALFFIITVAPLLQEELEEIGPIKEPAPVEFTFETIGWSVLAVVVLILFGVLVYKQYKIYAKNKYRRDAIKKLNQIQNQTDGNYVQINKINVLLKKVAIITFGRDNVAAIYGDEWYLFLDSKTKNTDFSSYSNAFSKAVYENENVDSSEYNKIVKLTKTWIKSHA